MNTKTHPSILPIKRSLKMNGEMTGIPEFYSGRAIFITGATGFLGKVLLEKLLRSCPSVSKIYILVRPKRDQDIATRVINMLKSKLFENLREAQPDFTRRVVPVSGDILEPGLGLSDKDRQVLVEEVSIVFHSAATVKFNEPLKLAVRMNVLGVRKMLELCHQMSKLDAMVHVSTAYCNCDQDVVTETIYPPPLHPLKVIDATEWMDDDVIDTLTPYLIKPRPNTYTYTKSIAEYILLQERGDLPCTIVRPSIVGASHQEPFPGWVDNLNGPAGVAAAIGKGMLRSMYGNFHGTADLIPVDMATNLIIAASWSVAIERPSDIPVYNCTSGELNRLTWGQLERAFSEYYMRVPLNSTLRLPDIRLTMNKSWHFIHFWLNHYVPAWITDAVLWAQGKKTMVTRLQNKMWKSINTLDYFTSHQWVFTTQNVIDLHLKLYAEDQEVFNFDVTRINWRQYLEDYCLGVKQFALKEDMSNIDSCRKAINRLVMINRVINITALVLFVRFLVPRVAMDKRLWFYAISLAVKILNQLPGFARS